MTASTQLKSLIAGLAAVAAIGTAVAQSTPPNPNVTNPAVGAGQQSSQDTPMGTTGVQGASGSAPATMGSTMGSGTSGTTGTTGTTGTAGSASTMGAGADMGTTRPTRADRN